MVNHHQLPEVLTPQGDICVPLFIPAHTDYVALLVGALRKLELQRHYEVDENQSYKIVTEQWRERTLNPLIEALTEATGCYDCDLGDCKEYPASADFISYTPQNPFTEQELVPDGYLTSPFTRWANFIPLVPDFLADFLANQVAELTGYESNDVIVDISSIPLLASWEQLISGAFPQIEIAVSGAGVAELEMINFPLGGRAIITVDVQPNIADIFLGIFGNGEISIESNRDLISLPIETAPTMIHEIEIDDDDDHIIYITFVPVVDDSSIPINFGGGLRSVALCGSLRPQGDPPPLSIISGADLPSRFRLNNSCELEYQIYDPNNGGAIVVDWTLVEGWDTNSATCFQGVAGLNGTDGTDGLDGTDGTDGTNGDNGVTNEYPPLPTQASEPDELCGASWEIAEQLSAFIADVLTDSQTITLSEFLTAFFNLGGWVADTLKLLWDFAIANWYAGLDADVAAEISTIAEYLYCNELDMTATKDDINNDGALSATVKAAYIGAIDALSDGKISLWAFVGSQRTGDDCSAFCPQATWVEYDFTVQDHGFTVWSFGSRPYGEYVNGVGWRCQWSNIGGDQDNRMYIEKINMASLFDMTHIEVDYIANEFNNGGQSAIRGLIGTSNQFATVIDDSEYTIDGQEHMVATIHEDNDLDGIRWNLVSNTAPAQPDAVIIKRLRVRYINGNPPEGGVML